MTALCSAVTGVGMGQPGSSAPAGRVPPRAEGLSVDQRVHDCGLLTGSPLQGEGRI